MSNVRGCMRRRPRPDDPDHGIEHRVARLEEQMGDVSAVVAELQADDAELQASVAQINTDAAAVGTQLAADATSINDLQTEVANLENQINSGGTITADDLANLTQLSADLKTSNTTAQEAHSALLAALPTPST